MRTSDSLLISRYQAWNEDSYSLPEDKGIFDKLYLTNQFIGHKLDHNYVFSQPEIFGLSLGVITITYYTINWVGQLNMIHHSLFDNEGI